MDDGSHLQKVPQLEYYKVKALRFAPKWEGGLLGVDGERVPFTPIDIRVCDGAISVAAKPVATGQIVGLGAEGAGPAAVVRRLSAAMQSSVSKEKSPVFSALPTSDGGSDQAQPPPSS
uniref:Uncharacterized protein n=1 Tax=Eutreptiella gymnastica TaxID=73025 RepID=A0A7S4G8E8_9EUGL